MVMAKPPSAKKSATATPKKSISNKASLTMPKNKKPWLVIIIILFVFPAGVFAYNKYLDYKNVQDMKTLLSDFQQLEKEMEDKTGEQFTINAACGSVGKFATSYACSVVLKPNSSVVTGEIADVFDKARFDSGAVVCGRFSKIGYKVNTTEDYFGCRALHVRVSTESNAEKIFYDYDESPGSPF